MMTNIYEQVTQNIINYLNAPLTWEKGWNLCMPHNISTGKEYRGINILLLWSYMANQGFRSCKFGSFQQWKNKKAFVKKGSKGNEIIFFKVYDKKVNNVNTDENSDDIDVETKKSIVMRTYYVFNMDQTTFEEAKNETLEPIDSIINKIVTSGKINFTCGGLQAYYSPTTDGINLPAFDSFKSKESLLETLLHEVGHWTGKKMGRNYGKFGDLAYAYEELVAELTSAYVAAHLGYCQHLQQNNAAYLQHWNKILGADCKAIFKAASEAQKAADYIIKEFSL